MGRDNTTTITISQDLSTLGPEATQDDLDGYAQNLAEHLAERFGGTFEVEIGLVPRVSTNREDADEIEEYLRDLESSDGWVELLPKR